jgi:hypothetical protein
MPSLQPRHNRRKEDCRCEDLKQIFGSGAPGQCGPCVFREILIELHEKGFVEIRREHALKYADCGIEIRTTQDHRSWAPAWAVMLVDFFLEDPRHREWLPPLLCRAAVDVTFAEAVATILMTAGVEAVIRVRDFAIANGVVLAR